MGIYNMFLWKYMQGSSVVLCSCTFDYLEKYIWINCGGMFHSLWTGFKSEVSDKLFELPSPPPHHTTATMHETHFAQRRVMAPQNMLFLYDYFSLYIMVTLARYARQNAFFRLNGRRYACKDLSILKLFYILYRSSPRGRKSCPTSVGDRINVEELGTERVRGVYIGLGLAMCMYLICR